MPLNIDLNSPPPKQNRELSDNDRLSIFAKLLESSEDGKPKHGVIGQLAESMNVDRSTIFRVWQRGINSLSEDSHVPDVSSRKKGRVGPKTKPFDSTQVSQIDLRRRTNIRSLSAALCKSKSTVHRLIKGGKIRPHTNAVKPFLTEGNKKARLSFCLSMLDETTLKDNPTFKSMYNHVHIDEKWFFMMNESEKYYLLPEEADPIRGCKSKHFIIKVMFVAVVARPRFDTEGNCTFDGKIGIFLFTYEEPAKRSSKNREAGTMLTKPILSVTKDVYRAFLLEKVLPAIRARWPLEFDGIQTIFIQQC